MKTRTLLVCLQYKGFDPIRTAKSEYRKNSLCGHQCSDSLLPGALTFHMYFFFLSHTGLSQYSILAFTPSFCCMYVLRLTVIQSF